MQCKNNLLLVFLTAGLLIYSVQAVAQDIPKPMREGKTLEEMTSIMKTEGKRGLLYIEAYNSGGCNPDLRKGVFENEKMIARIESTFVIFWVDFEKDWKSETGFFKRYNVRGIPTVVLINKEGKMINKLVGFDGSAEEYMKRLEKAASESHISLKDDYEDNPEDVEASLNYADILYKSFEVEKALEIYEEIVDKIIEESTALKVYTYMSECYRLSEDRKKAVEILEKGLAKGIFQDEKYVIYCQLGNLISEYDDSLGPVEKEDYVEALKYYQMIPKNAKDFKTYNKSLDNKKRIDFSLRTAKINIPIAYLKTGEEGIGSLMFEKLLAQTYDKKNYDELIFLFRKCIFHEAYLNEALLWAEKANEQTEGKNDRILTDYFRLLQLCGHYDKAIELQKYRLEKTKSEQEKDYEMQRLAELYFQSGQNEKGNEIFQKLYDDKKNNIDELVYLAIGCNQFDVNLRRALNWTERAIDLSQNDSYAKESHWLRSRPGLVYNQCAELLFKTGKVKEAIDTIKKAIEIAYFEDDRRYYKKNLEKFKAALKNK